MGRIRYGLTKGSNGWLQQVSIAFINHRLEKSILVASNAANRATCDSSEPETLKSVRSPDSKRRLEGLRELWIVKIAESRSFASLLHDPASLMTSLSLSRSLAGSISHSLALHGSRRDIIEQHMEYTHFHHYQMLPRHP